MKAKDKKVITLVMLGGITFTVSFIYVILAIGPSDNTTSIDMRKQALQACVAKGGVPILNGYDRLTDCKFKE